MKNTILYYPTINIPTRSWLRNALLYWDEVSSIVPKSWDDKILIKLSPDIQYLMDEQQFRPIMPEDLFQNGDNWQSFHDFETEFKEIVSSQNFINLMPRRSKVRTSYREISTSKIHRNKTTDVITDFLYEKGLALRENNSEWINFENRTALLYMSLLAKYLAAVDSENTTIGTDYRSYERINFRRVKENIGFPVVNFNFNNVLPTPMDNVPFERIIYFKKKRSDNLDHFKITMNEFHSEISNATSLEEIKGLTFKFKNQLKNGVHDLDKVFKDERLAYRFRSLRSLVSFKSLFPWTVVGSMINSQINLISIPLTMSIAGVTYAGGIELAGNYIEYRNAKRAQLRTSPFSYVSYAEKYGLIQPASKIRTTEQDD